MPHPRQDVQPQAQVAALRRRLQSSPVRADISGAAGHRHAAVTTRLDDALASEIVRVMRDRWHPTLACLAQPPETAGGSDAAGIAPVSHVDGIAERIVQLGGEREFRQVTFAAVMASPPEAGMLMLDVLRENLAYERMLVESHLGFLRYLGSSDPVTGNLLETMLAAQNACVRRLAPRLAQLTAARGGRSTPDS